MNQVYVYCTPTVNKTAYQCMSCSPIISPTPARIDWNLHAFPHYLVARLGWSIGLSGYLHSSKMFHITSRYQQLRIGWLQDPQKLLKHPGLPPSFSCWTILDWQQQGNAVGVENPFATLMLLIFHYFDVVMETGQLDANLIDALSLEMIYIK